MTEEFGKAGSAHPYDVLKHRVAIIGYADTNGAENAALALSYHSCLPADITASLLQLLQKSDKMNRHLACLPLSSKNALSEPNITTIEGPISKFGSPWTLVTNFARAKYSTLPHGIF